MGKTHKLFFMNENFEALVLKCKIKIQEKINEYESKIKVKNSKNEAKNHKE